MRRASLGPLLRFARRSSGLLPPSSLLPSLLPPPAPATPTRPFSSPPSAPRTPRPRQHPLSSATPAQLSLNKSLTSVPLSAASAPADLLSLHRSHGRLFNAVNYATLISRLGRAAAMGRAKAGKAGRPPPASISAHPSFPPMLASLTRHLEGSLPLFSPRAVANIVHGLAKLRVLHPPLLAAVVGSEASALHFSRGAAPQALSNLCLGLAHLGYAPARAFLLGVVSPLAGRLLGGEGATTQAAANTAWAYARLGARCPDMFGAIAEAAPKLLPGATPQELANLAWAYATLGIPAPGLFRAIDGLSGRVVREGEVHAVSTLLWAFATAGHPEAEAFGHAADPAFFPRVAREMTAQNLSNLAWAYAAAGRRSPALFDAIGRRASDVAAGGAQATSNTAWAFARLGAPGARLLAIAERGGPGEGASGQGVANVCWAMARSGCHAPR